MTDQIITDVDAEEIQDRLLLSTVQKIKKLCAIPGKDRVEKVEFENCGYTAICEKGLHKEGDLVLFTKYDSIVPEIEPFEWMRDFKFRVKPKSFTIKDEDGTVIGKIYSQGIVVRLENIDKWYLSRGLTGCVGEYQEAEDLTISLNVRKYIPAVAKGNSLGSMKSKGNFPTHLIDKTDENNLAAKPKLLDKYQGQHVVARLKMEGSSLTTFIHPEDGELHVCSRNNDLTEEEGNKFWHAVNRHHLKDKMKKYPHYCIQAELMGPGVQGNKLKLTEPDMYVFTITDLRDRTRLSDSEMANVAADLGLKVSPLVGSWFKFNHTYEEMQEMADGLEYACEDGTKTPAEGMVLRLANQEHSDKLLGYLSNKVINRNYSL